jgi:hypothetical protein
MAHHRLGHADQARQALEKATELLDQPHSKIGSDWNSDDDWHNWLRFYLIRQEADRLLNGEASP